MLRTAIAGCGSIAAAHAKCLAEMENAKMIAFADVRPERAERFAEQYGGRAYDSIDAMLAAEQIDVLHICLPHYLHVPVSVQALEAGINVFMEKPPAISVEQFEQLRAAVGAAKAQLGICFQNRYNPCTKAVKELIASGKAGRVLGVRGIVNWSRGPAYYTDSGWRGTVEKEGGSVLINQSIHTMDLMLYLCGLKPLSVEASMMNHHLKGVIETEDTMEAYIAFEGGCAGNFYATNAYSANAKPIIELACENMTLRIEDPDATVIYPDGKRELLPLPTVTGHGKDYWGTGHGKCIGDFYGCVERGERFWLNVDAVADTAKVMLGAYRSARTGAEISFTED